MKILAAQLLRRAAQSCELLLDFTRRAFLAPVLLVLLRISGDFFDRSYYVERYGHGGRLRRFSPLLEFGLIGAWRLRDPNAVFSQERALASRPNATIFPPVLDWLLRWDIRFGLVTWPEPQAPAAPPTARPGTMPATAVEADRLDELWHVLGAEATALQHVGHAATPTSAVREALKARAAVARIDPAGQAVQALLARLPSTPDHVAVLPWLDVSGGSERVTERLLDLLTQTYGTHEFAIIAPDAVFAYPADRPRRWPGVPLAAFNDVVPDANQELRVRILDRLIIELRPRTLHCINSLTAWLAIRQFGRHYRNDTAMFVNIYSAVRNDNDVAGGFFFDLPTLLDDLAGVLVDNRAVIAHARRGFGLTPSALAKFHFIPTPIVGFDGPAALPVMPPAQGRPPHTLWLSRLASEKRLDVLGAVAQRLPERRFSVYGSAVRNAPVDMSWAAAPNITLHGAFGHLRDLPSDFDAYMFTSRGEGMPLAVLEATALGLPVVAPDVGGIGEFIDAETGWLVGAPDAIDEYVAALETIRQNPGEALRRTRNAQARLVERHSWPAFRQAVARVPGFLPETRA